MNLIIRILVLICSNLLFTTFFLGASLLSIYFNANFFATIGGFLPQGNLIDVSYLKSLPLLGFVLPTKEVMKEIVIAGQITNKTFSFIPASQLSVLCVGLLFDLVKCFSSMLKNAQLAKGDFEGAEKWKVKGLVLFMISICATTGSFYYAAVDSNNKKIILEETKQKIDELKSTLKEDKEIMQSNTARGIVTATEKVSGARLDKDSEALKALEEKRDQLLIHESNPISNTFLAALIGLSVAFVLEWVIKLTLLSLTFTRTATANERTAIRAKSAPFSIKTLFKPLQGQSLHIRAPILFNQTLTRFEFNVPKMRPTTLTRTDSFDAANSTIESNFKNTTLNTIYNPITMSVKISDSLTNESKSESIKKNDEKPVAFQQKKRIVSRKKDSKSADKQNSKGQKKDLKSKSKTAASAEKKSDLSEKTSLENGSWLTNKIKEIEEKKTEHTIDDIPNLPTNELMIISKLVTKAANEEIKINKTRLKRTSKNMLNEVN